MKNKNQAPFTRATDFDQEDSSFIEADAVLAIVANVVLSLGVFALLMCAIAVLAQVPDSGWTRLVLALWGV